MLMYIGLGSNLGDRVAYLWRALQLLAELPGCRIERISPIYESEPVGPASQDWFLNAVAVVDTGLAPPELLHEAKRIEREIGRVPSERWGARVIDLDLLLCGDVEMRSAELTLPHAELWNRRFALVPLGDVAQDEALKRRVEQRLVVLGTTPIVRPYTPGIASVGDL